MQNAVILRRGGQCHDIRHRGRRARQQQGVEAGVARRRVDAGVFGEPVSALVAGLVVWYTKLAGTVVTGTIAQPLKAEEPLLMIVAKAVAVLPSSTERLDGNTAETSASGTTAGGVIRPILLPFVSANHNPPSGPAAMPTGPLPAVGVGNSVIAPDIVIWPILLPLASVNHSAPSDPAAISAGKL